MGDKIRGALFGVLGDIKGLRVLDAYSGSGAISLEAISRGAKSVIAIDNDKDAQVGIQKNIVKFGLGNQVSLFCGNVKSWSNRWPNELFDLVICDPPYTDIRRDHLRKLAHHARPGGVVVFSLPPGVNTMLDAGEFNLLSTKSYGDAILSFFRKKV